MNDIDKITPRLYRAVPLLLSDGDPAAITLGIEGLTIRLTHSATQQVAEAMLLGLPGTWTAVSETEDRVQHELELIPDADGWIEVRITRHAPLRVSTEAVCLSASTFATIANGLVDEVDSIIINEERFASRGRGAA